MTFTTALDLPLAALPEYPTFGESLAFQLNGLIVVFLALGSIWGLLELMGVFFRRRREQAVAIPPASASAAETPAPVAAHGAIPPEILAVIAAAVATVVNQPHRISQVAAESPSRDWAREGRREIFGSHKLR